MQARILSAHPKQVASDLHFSITIAIPNNLPHANTPIEHMQANEGGFDATALIAFARKADVSWIAA